MTVRSTTFKDLPISNEAQLIPEGSSRTTVGDEILGDLENPDWERYQKAHLVWDSEIGETKAGYKFPIARMVDGELTVIESQLGLAAAAINGARGGTALPQKVAKQAFNHLLRYYRKSDIPKDQQPSFGGATVATKNFERITLSSVALAQLDDSIGPKWVQVATEGEYLGYKSGGQPFVFNEAIFNQLIENFRKHPDYKADANGVGCMGLIAWDFHHASEMYPGDGSIPVTGTPAQGWTLELQVRKPEAGTGPSELWALTDFLEPARSYIKNGQYKWASVSVWLDAIDALTGESIGAVLTSVAMTNAPFIEGMAQLVASKGVQDRRVSTGHVYEAAVDEMEAFKNLKYILDMPETTTSEELIEEYQKLQTWAATEPPAGVDFDNILGQLRRNFNLPLLTPASDVISTALAVINKVTGPSVPGSTTPEGGAIGADSHGHKPKTATTASKGELEMLAQLSKKLGVREVEAEVTNAVDDAVQLRAQIKVALGSDKDSNAVLLQLAEEAGGVKGKLTALLKALGVEDAEAAVGQIAEMFTQVEQLKTLMPELEELKEFKAVSEDAAAVADVEEVLNSRGLPEDLKDALLLFRQEKPEKFAEKYPKGNSDVKNLTQNVATKGNTSINTKTGELETSAGAGDEGVDLANYEGRNHLEKVMSFISATVEGGAKMKHEELFVKACVANKTAKFFDSSVA